jgi:hypothetical protein
MRSTGIIMFEIPKTINHARTIDGILDKSRMKSVVAPM